MAISQKLLAALKTATEAQTNALERARQLQVKRQDENAVDRLATAMESLGKINTFIGPQGPKGDTPIRGIDYFTTQDVGMFLEAATPVKGKHYRDGIDGEKGDRGERGIQGIQGEIGPRGEDANMEEAKGMMEECMTKHEKEKDHALLHDSKMIGEYELDTASLQEGDYLQVKGKKLVGVKIQMPDMGAVRGWVSSQGVSNFKSYSVTANTTIESMAIYVIDASAGDITITVPSAAGRENFWFELLRIDSSANTVTVVPTGSELLNDMTSYVMQQWTDLRIFAYNGGYLIRSAS